MRLDLFLKASRICPRRTIAQKLCDASVVSVNGVVAKSAHAVKVGDEISIKRRDKVTTIKVMKVPSDKQTAKKDACELYVVVSEENLEMI